MMGIDSNRATHLNATYKFVFVTQTSITIRRIKTLETQQSVCIFYGRKTGNNVGGIVNVHS